MPLAPAFDIEDEQVEETHAPTGGLVDTLNLDLLKGDEASVMVNFHHDRLSLDKRQGAAEVGVPTPDLVCFGGYHYRQKNATTEMMLRVQGSKLYKGTGANWVGAVSGLAAASDADLFGNGVYLGTWVQYNDRVFYFDGGTRRKYFDGTIRTAGVFAGQTPAKGIIRGKLTGGSLGAGVYKFKYSFYNPATAEESNLSEASLGITAVANDRIAIWIPAYTGKEFDFRFTSVRLYRTKVDGETYFFERQVDNLWKLSYYGHYMGMLDKADADLGEEGASDNGLIPKMRYALIFEEMIVGTGNPDSPSTVYWSAKSEPTRWPPVQALDVEKDNGDPITGIFKLAEQLYVVKQSTGVFRLTSGTAPDGSPVLTAEVVSPDVGCLSHHSIVTFDGQAYWADAKGIWRFNGQQVTNISDAKIRQRWKTLVSGSNVTRAFGIHDRQPDHQYYRLTIEDPDDSDKAYDLIYDATQGAWFQDLFGVDASSGWSNRVSWLYRDSKGRYWVYHADATGRAFRLRSSPNGSAVYTDAGRPIKANWKSRHWGGMDGVLPLYVDLEYERSTAGLTSGPVTVRLYRDGKTAADVTDSSSVILYDVNSPAPGAPDATLPDPTRASHSVRINFDADWCRRFAFEIESNMTNADLRVLWYRVGYMKRGPMLKAR